MPHIFEGEIKKQIESIRPPVNIRNDLDIGYSFVDYTLEVFEIRPKWDNPSVKSNSSIAKTKFIKSKNIWKVYWMRGSGKWQLYSPYEECKSLNEFFKILKEDKHHCFWG